MMVSSAALAQEQNKGYRGFDDLGYGIGVGDCEFGRFSIETSHGYQFGIMGHICDHFYGIFHRDKYFVRENMAVSLNFIKFASYINKFKTCMERINRIKAVLAETGHTGKWLADQVGRDKATVSKWCTNSIQPDLNMLAKIAEVLKVNIRVLLVDK